MHLRELLRGQNERYVFTLIQKFRYADGRAYPVLSERDDIIVITDEAHRTQYDRLAANMRQALPNAAFIGFTGTPLIAGEEERRARFRRLRLDLQLPAIDRRWRDRAALLRGAEAGDATRRTRN